MSEKNSEKTKPLSLDIEEAEKVLREELSDAGWRAIDIIFEAAEDDLRKGNAPAGSSTGFGVEPDPRQVVNTERRQLQAIHALRGMFQALKPKD